ncbi:hypothetical protein QVD17_10227 [Tagetes erecta]|uniref:Uncharacterized protein n=1 Tax=Tagetes erecta TaxID=13708 RepID=A0AAD8L7H8_TARER|nr:hypothetical protein QVD17_10227 [Tagetes erecta]
MCVVVCERENKDTSKTQSVELGSPLSLYLHSVFKFLFSKQRERERKSAMRTVAHNTPNVQHSSPLFLFSG